MVLMKQQFIITHTIPETEIPTLLESWVKNTPVKMLCPQKKLTSFIFVKHNMLTCWSIKNVSWFFPLSCKIVYRWVMTDSCFMGSMITDSLPLLSRS